MVKFTVITCTFNAQSVIARTLASVLEQSYPHVEHLIIDGNSRDATLQLANDYAEESAREAASHEVVIISEPDKGLYDAMNKGLRMASGDYLVYLNAGDVFPERDTLELVPWVRKRYIRVCSMVIRISWTMKGVSFVIVACRLPKICLGNPFEGACWCVIKHFMPVQTWLRHTPITCNIVILRMWIGVSEL